MVVVFSGLTALVTMVVSTGIEVSVQSPANEMSQSYLVSQHSSC